MKKINCFGDICPVPILKIQNELKITKTNDSFMIIIDHSCVLESIKDYFKNTNYSIEIEEVLNGVWEIIIQKNN
ncbi:sulfurtransferase TusA family protein [Clostridiaceae bacterium HSG29]|nr:sulfurtransferase TusA family protein [Clostridiaceae bacterium HSG29]